jgi:hypothetical protein
MRMMACYVFTSLSLLALTAQAHDPKETIASLEAKLMKLGEPKLMGTEKAGDLMVPGIYYGSRKINNNYDIVDSIKRETGATATVFVKHGDEFVRVSTNVLTQDDKRGVGTLLARAKAYAAVTKGEPFCGSVDVLGTAFNACYYPIKDKAAKVIGVTYIGYKK